jgi:signal transduction histidine kinase
VLTAYYLASEGCANVAKHARSTHARIEVSTGADELLVRVVDDGVGGADPRGPGLSGLRDRIQALDGRLRVHSPHDGGTIVEARLPIRTARDDRARSSRSFPA